MSPPRPIPHSDHSSSSPKSRRSARSSSSHSSCSPKQSATSELANQTNGKEEKLPSKEAGEEEEEEEEEAAGVTKDGSDGGKWRSLSVVSSGLKKSKPPECSADDGQMTLTSVDQSSPAHKITASGVNSGAPSWQGIENKSPPQKSPKAVISGFGIFSKNNNLDGGSSTIPAAFRK